MLWSYYGLLKVHPGSLQIIVMRLCIIPGVIEKLVIVQDKSQIFNDFHFSITMCDPVR